jgi:hypothetical protein
VTCKRDAALREKLRGILGASVKCKDDLGCGRSNAFAKVMDVFTIRHRMKVGQFQGRARDLQGQSSP